jgi:peptide-methionine (R)-S-oxide reductase
MKDTEPHPHDDPRYPVRKTDAEWRAELDPLQYRVARHAETERAFIGKYWDHFEDGRYLCVGCGRCIALCPASLDITKAISEVK